MSDRELYEKVARAVAKALSEVEMELAQKQERSIPMMEKVRKAHERLMKGLFPDIFAAAVQLYERVWNDHVSATYYLDETRIRDHTRV